MDIGYYLAIVNTYLSDLDGNYWMNGDEIIYKDLKNRIMLNRNYFFKWFANMIKDIKTSYDYIKYEDIKELMEVNL